MTDSVKKIKKNKTEYVTANGTEVYFMMVPYMLMETIAQEIPEPPVPTFFNKTKGIEQENPNDPAYIEALKKTQEMRQRASLDTLLYVGVELKEPMPPLSEWRSDLDRINDATNKSVLEGYDLRKERDQDVLYKRYFVLVSPADVAAMYEHCTVSWEAIKRQLKKFRDNAKG